ncbi:MAG: hypothetical protein AB7P34_11730 [Vicinamibacterales bacterium]
MNIHPTNPASEKGVALIVVLLLLAVMAGLTTGLTLNGQTEIAMATNEAYYAGTRAAAEAGMNRAIEQITADTATDILAAGAVPVIGNGPFNLTTDYAYRFEVYDDDDPALYVTALTAGQLAQMGENDDPDVDANTRLILRAIGTGPKGTTVIIGRVLSSTPTPGIPIINNILSNPAVLVNGNLDISGNIKVLGTRGNVHANGDITGGGSEDISGDVTATGTVDDDLDPDGLKAGGMPPMTVPEIKASDYFNLADWVLTSSGTITRPDGTACGGGDPCPSGWSFSGGIWSASGALPTSSTYYVEGSAEVHGTGKSSFTEISIITEGSLKITGNGKFQPENGAGIQFVTNGDFELGGTVDADDFVDMDGQILVREQMKVYGNSEFQGRIMVEDRDSDTNAYDASTNPNGRRGSSTFDTNNMSGNMTVTYNGSLGEITTTITIPGGATTYTNNFSGWIEQ